MKLSNLSNKEEQMKTESEIRKLRGESVWERTGLCGRGAKMKVSIGGLWERE